MQTSTATPTQEPTPVAPGRTTFGLPADARSVLAGARAEREAADAAEARLLQAACAWADLHPADSIPEAATFRSRGFGDTGIPVAGPGAPLVTEFAVAEFAAAVGLTTEAGKALIGDSLELRHRLPRTWARVVAGDLPAWRARRVAEETQCLSIEAAAFVDAQVAPFAHKIRPWQLQRLVDAAIARFMPEEAERRRREAADGRHFDVDHEQVSFQGTSRVSGELDLADALDLERAVATRAEQLKALGSTDSLDGRRATAVGELARRDLALDLEPDLDSKADAGTGPNPDETHSEDADPEGEGTDAAPQAGPAPGRRSTREVVLHVHLSQAALESRTGLARVEITRGIVTAEQVAAWCGIDTARVTVKPIKDLADRTPVDAYEVPDALAEQVALRDSTCVFPWCTRPARRCDTDHVVPHARGGPTESGNLAPVCRRHHRLKTHGSWQVSVLEPGSYLWRSRYGYRFVRDHTGTLDVSDRPDVSDFPEITDRTSLPPPHD